MPDPRLALVSDAVLPFHTGGKETRHHEIAKRLAGAGFDVEVHTMRWWNGRGDFHHGPVRYRALTRLWPMYRGERRSITQAVLFAASAFRLLFRRFDVVEADAVPVVQVFTLRVVCWVRRRRLVVTWHEVWGAANWRRYLGRWGWVAAMLERWALALPDHIVSPSPSTAGRIRAIVGDGDRVSVVPNGIDVVAIENTPPSRAACDVIYVGRLIRHKNVDALVRCVAVLRDRGWAGVCRIVGTGTEDEALRRLVLDLDLGEQVRFDGRLDDAADVVGAMKSARVFVSLSEREGFGISVLEALACGLPVVAYDHPDNHARHLLTDRVNAVLVPCLDPSQLADALEWALGHAPDMTDAAVAAARDYDWGAIARQIGKVYAP